MDERERASRPQDIYILHHLVSHLTAAERWEELHALVGEGEGERQEWAEAKHNLNGSYASYLADLRLAWQHADEEGRAQHSYVVGRQVRYALIESSVRSLAANIPPDLLAALVENQIPGWTPKAALEYARQIPDEELRCQTLKCLAPTLPSNLLAEGLVDIRWIHAPANQMQVLNAFVPHLPSDLLGNALFTAQDIRDELCRALALKTLMMHSSPDLLLDVLAEASKMTDKTARFEILSDIRFPKGLLAEALAVAQENMETENRARVIESLRPFTLTQSERHMLAKKHWGLEPKGSYLYPATEWKLPQGLPLKLRQRVCIDALAAVMKIGDLTERFQVVVKLAPYLPEQILTDVFGETRKIRDNLACITALIDLMPYLSSELQQQARVAVIEALPIAKEITDEYKRGEFLSRLAPFLSAESLAEVLTMIRELRDPGFLMSDRTAGLIHLAPHLSSDQLPEALFIARGVAGDYDRAKALCSLAPKLSQQLLAEAVKIAQEIQQAEACALALSGLAPYLSTRLLENTLMTIHQAHETKDIEQNRSMVGSALEPAGSLEQMLSEMSMDKLTDSDKCTIALSGLAARLSRESLGEILTTTWYLNGEYHRVEVLERLIPYLPSELLSKAFAITKGIEDESLRARAVITLAPHLPTEMLSSALTIGLGIKDAHERATVLCELVPRLPSELTNSILADVLSSLQDTDNGYFRAQVVEKIAEHLPRELISHALEVVQGIEEIPARVDALVKLAAHLPAAESEKVLRFALEAVYQIGYPAIVGSETALRARSDALSAIAKLLVVWAQEQRHTAWSLWRESLHKLAGQRRSRLLADLNAVMPFIVGFGGFEGAKEMSRAILDVGRWWP